MPPASNSIETRTGRAAPSCILARQSSVLRGIRAAQCALLLLSVSAAWSQDAALPRLQFATTNVNLGTLLPTQKMKYDFVFTNAGNAVLEITSLHSGCGCTTSEDWDRTVEPGKTGRIPIEFNPATFNGPVKRSIRVTSNDPNLASQTLGIEATIVRPFDIKPAFVIFMPVQGEEKTETKVANIVNNMPEEVTLDSPVSTNPRFQTEVKTIRPGREFELHVTWLESLDGAASNPSGTITIPTSSTNVPPLHINVSARMQPAITVLPQMIRLPTPPISPDFLLGVTIRNNGTRPIAVSNASINLDGTEVNVKETEGGKSFLLSLTFPSDLQLNPQDKVALTVKTTHPNYPEITVPVSQAMRTPPLVK